MGIRRMLVLLVSAFCTIAISYGAAGATGGELSQNDSALLHLDRLHTHPLGHKALQFGIDRSVLDGHRIQGRLAAPSFVFFSVVGDFSRSVHIAASLCDGQSEQSPWGINCICSAPHSTPHH